MAERKEITVRATQREGRGKNDAGRLRRNGLVPLTIYGGEGGVVAAAASRAELAAILRSDAGHNAIFTLDVEGVGASEVRFLDRQIDPLRGWLMHADLRRLVQGEKIEITVPLHLTGEPVGVIDGGGVLEQIMREIDIRVSPRDIPDAISADVSHLGVHDVLHVSDIPANEQIEILSAPDMVIATVGLMREEEVAPAPVVDEAAAEPEVIGKGKKEDEDEGKK